MATRPGRTKTTWVKAFQDMRKWALDQRKLGKESVEDLLDLVSLQNVKAALSRFKSKTSTGLRRASLRELRYAPDYILEDLAKLLKDIRGNHWTILLHGGDPSPYTQEIFRLQEDLHLPFVLENPAISLGASVQKVG